LAQCLEIKSSFSVVDEEQFIPDLEWIRFRSDFVENFSECFRSSRIRHYIAKGNVNFIINCTSCHHIIKLKVRSSKIYQGSQAVTIDRPSVNVEPLVVCFKI
jgi:hypothetical protein